MGKILISISVTPAIFLFLLCEAVTQIQRFMQMSVLKLFKFDLVLDYNVKKLNIAVDAFNFCSITVFEIKGLEIKPWATRHRIDHKLNESLLFNGITNMLIAFHIQLSEKDFPKLKMHLAIQKVIHYLLPIFFVAYLVNFSIVELLCLCDVE